MHNGCQGVGNLKKFVQRKRKPPVGGSLAEQRRKSPQTQLWESHWSLTAVDIVKTLWFYKTTGPWQVNIPVCWDDIHCKSIKSGEKFRSQADPWFIMLAFYASFQCSLTRSSLLNISICLLPNENSSQILMGDLPIGKRPGLIGRFFLQITSLSADFGFCV